MAYTENKQVPGLDQLSGALDGTEQLIAYREDQPNGLTRVALSDVADYCGKEASEPVTPIYQFSTARRLITGTDKVGEVFRADGSSANFTFDANGYADTASMVSFLGVQAGYWGVITNNAVGQVDFFRPNSADAIANSPRVNLTGFNGRPCMDFATAGKSLYDRNAAQIEATNITAQIVFKPGSTTNSQALFWMQGASDAQSLAFSHNGATNGRIGIYQNGAWQYTGTPASNGAQVLSFICSTADGVTVLVNGQIISTGLTYSPSAFYSALQIGNTFGAVGPFTGLIAEVRLWSGAMAVSTMQRLDAEAMSFYRIDNAGGIYKATAGDSDLVLVRDTATGVFNEVPASALPGGGGVESVTFNPADYGAVGDGTTSDATAFTNMLAAISAAGGGKIQLDDLSYSINSQIGLASWSNTTIDGNAIGELTKTSANTLRIISSGTQGAPHSSTTPQNENLHFQNLTIQGLGTIAGNNASLINNSGNIFQLLSSFNVSFDNCRFYNVDNGAIRLPATSEGDLFYTLNLTPTVVSTTEFSVPGDQTAVFVPGSGEANFIGVFNGSTGAIQNLKACGYVTSAVFDGTKTNVVLNLTKGTITAPVTATAKIRTLTSFKGYVNIHDSYFENVKQPLTTNTNGTDHVKVRFSYLKDCGSLKPTSQVFGNNYHVYEGNVLDNCAERIFFQGTNKGFVRNNIFFNGTGTGGNNYASLLISPNTEQIVYEDKNTIFFEGNYCEGDYQTCALEGNNIQLYDTLVIRNNTFKNITAGKLFGVLPFLGRFRRVIIENNQFIDIGSGVDIFRFVTDSFSTDTHIEQVIIRHNRGNGGRYWLYIDSDKVSNTRFATDFQVYGNDMRGHKGHFLREVSGLWLRNNYLEYAASDGTANQFYFQSIINSRFEDNTISVSAGSTVAGTLFGIFSDCSNTAFKRNKITVGTGTQTVSAITNSSASINFVVEDNDITATNDALSITGTNLTGSIKRNRLRGGGTSTFYDLFIGANVGALQVEDNQYITGNVSIDFTGIRNVKSTTWNPPSISAGGSTSTTVTVPDAITSPVRDEIIVIPGVSLGGLLLDTNISTPGAFTNISGGTVARTSATTFTVTDAGVDHTSEFLQRRYVRFMVGGAILGYGYVASSTYNGTNITEVTVNVVEGTMPATLDDVDYWTNGVVTLTLYNNTAGAIDLASSTWYVQTRRRI